VDFPKYKNSKCMSRDFFILFHLRFLFTNCFSTYIPEVIAYKIFRNYADVV